MKKLMKSVIVLSLFCLCFASIGLSQVVATPLPPLGPEPSLTDWLMIVKSMGGISGIGALGIAALVTQVLMFALRSKLGEQAGAWRLAAVYFLTMVSGVIAMRMTGVDWGGALLHSNTLAAFQVFGHQVVSQAKDLKVDNKTVVEVKTDEPKPNPT